MSRDMFDKERLPPALDEFLRGSNPWWSGHQGKKPPPYHRKAFSHLLRDLQQEQPLSAGLILRGPRQVGKTTIQEQIIEHLIEKDGVRPERILRVQFDEIPSLRGLLDPILTISRWFEDRILQQSFNEAARAGERAFVFFDEVQNLADWAPQTKALIDHNALRVLITGSSALRIKAGHDSLAGRVRTVELGPLLLREIAGIRFQEDIPGVLEGNGIDRLKEIEFWREAREHGIKYRETRDRSFRAFSERGAYPVAQAAGQDWAQVAEYLNETIVQRAIVHDLRQGEKGRKRDRQLLEEVFGIACRYAGQAPGQALMVQQVKHALGADVSFQRIRHYLDFLDGTLLIKLIRPMEIRLKKKKGHSKICLCDPGIRASWLKEQVPLSPDELARAPHLTDLAGHIAESVAGYFLGSIPNAGINHFPERGIEPEVDFVLTVGEKRIPIEVKYQGRVSDQDTFGLRAFLEKTVYNASCGILVTRSHDTTVLDPRIISMPLSTLMMLV